MKATLFLFLFFITNLYSQGIIVNEVSNGTSGSKEFIEFLVIGSDANPLGTVDINGWIFDDNSGDFEGSSGTGVAAGHYRFGAMPLLNPGDIVVVYNSSDQNLNISGPDETDSNNDGVYFLPINSSLLERCSGSPSSSGGTSYAGCTYTYDPGQTWSSIGLRNKGDAVQIRKPDLSFYHGFSYGDVLNPYPAFPNGNFSFNVQTGSGSGRNYYFECGDWTNAINYIRGNATSDSPGLPNSSVNTIFIQKIKDGSFNYLNVNDIGNCSLVLSEDDIKILYYFDNFNLELIFSSGVEYESYELWESIDGLEFNLVGNTNTNKYVIENFIQSKYFKVFGTSSKNEKWSSIIYVQDPNEKDLAYPIPTTEILFINSKIKIIECSIKSLDGSFIKKFNTNTLDLSDVPPAFYILNIKTEQGSKNLKLVIR